MGLKYFSSSQNFICGVKNADRGIYTYYRRLVTKLGLGSPIDVFRAQSTGFFPKVLISEKFKSSDMHHALKLTVPDRAFEEQTGAL